ncbi:hypothetical protein PM116P2_00004 [Parabacteroides phage PM116P2]|nr:hypothetical protein PM116P1_00002 [Parabacteroides phage PM116P1]WAX17423.1 hypothetical protein PM116P2_00004 [Parabacteroides phage PM116P2]
MMWDRVLGQKYFVVVRLTGGENNTYLLSVSKEQLEAFAVCDDYKKVQRMTARNSGYVHFDYGKVVRGSDGLWYKKKNIGDAKPEYTLPVGSFRVGITDAQMAVCKGTGDDLMNTVMLLGDEKITLRVSLKWVRSIMTAAGKYVMCEDFVFRSKAKAAKKGVPRGKVGNGYEVDLFIDATKLKGYESFNDKVQRYSQSI